MRRIVIPSLLALASTAHAADYRLAYSKAENLEVFVVHADNAQWCSDALQLRFAFTSDVTDPSAVGRLLPKLGGLLASQCPAASQLSWVSTDSSGSTLNNGSASQAGGWIAQTTAPAPDPVASAATPAVESATTATASPPPVSKAPIVPVAAPVAEPTPSPVAEAASATEPAPESPREPATATAVAAPPTVFSVAGWTPPLQKDAFAQVDFLTEVRDQNGCRFRLADKLEDGTENVRAVSSGVTCDADGYASGPGSLTLTRSDGVLLSRTGDAHFLAGLAFDAPPPALPIVGFDQDRNLLQLLHSEPASQTYYLLRLNRSYNGQWQSNNATVIALTENRDLFRELDSIKTTVDLAATRLDQVAPGIRNTHLYAMRDLNKGLRERNRDFWLYAISLSRHYRSKKWEYNPQRATNHLFAFERKESEEQRRAEAERLREEQRQRELMAQQAEQQLRLYSQLRNDVRRPEELYASMTEDASYSPTGSGSYLRMMRGGTATYSQIVEIGKEQDDGWLIGYPYQAVLLSNENTDQIEQGWHLIKGSAQLDPERKDDQNLPLTLITADSIQSCSEEQCADLKDPLALTRYRIGNPDWTPEEAEELIKRARPDQAATTGAAR